MPSQFAYYPMITRLLLPLSRGTAKHFISRGQLDTLVQNCLSILSPIHLVKHSNEVVDVQQTAVK